MTFRCNRYACHARRTKKCFGLNTEDWYVRDRSGLGQPTTSTTSWRVLRPATSSSFSPSPKGTEEAKLISPSRCSRCRSRDLPELTDEWVADNMSVSSTPSTRGLQISSERSQRAKAQHRMRQQAGTSLNDAVAKLVEIEAPEPMVACGPQPASAGHDPTIPGPGHRLRAVDAMPPAKTLSGFVEVECADSPSRPSRVDLALRADRRCRELRASTDHETRARVRPHGDAARPEGQGHPQGLRAERCRVRADRHRSARSKALDLAGARRNIRRRHRRRDRSR